MKRDCELWKYFVTIGVGIVGCGTDTKPAPSGKPINDGTTRTSSKIGSKEIADSMQRVADDNLREGLGIEEAHRVLNEHGLAQGIMDFSGGRMTLGFRRADTIRPTLLVILEPDASRAWLVTTWRVEE